MDDVVRNEIAFSANLPLPFRVLVLGGLGILGWAANLHGLTALGIDAASALELSTHHQSRTGAAPASPVPPPDTPLPTTRTGWKLVHHPAAVYGPVYRVFAWYALATAATWALYHHATRGEPELVDVFKFVPGVLALCLVMILVSPFDVWEKRERDKFIHSIHRCLFAQNRIYFADVVFADVFTSFAKVLGDVWLSVCMLLPGGSLLYPPLQQGLARWILPTIMSVPYAVRFRQCLVEYLFPTNESRRPLYNAIKYATAFPVIYLSAAQRLVASDPAVDADAHTRHWYGHHPLTHMWLLAAFVNSIYSFWWDVTYDWGFDLLRTKDKRTTATRALSPPRPLMLPRLHSRSALLGGQRDSDDLSKEALLDESEVVDQPPRPTKPYPFGLRSTLLFPLAIYPFAILVDLILRLTWSVKLSSHLHAYLDEDRAIFLIEFAEVFRRWLWVFLRVEWEVVKEREIRASVPPGTRMRRRAPDASIEDEFEMLAGSSATDEHERNSDEWQSRLRD